jgi:hypothetical protein
MHDRREALKRMAAGLLAAEALSSPHAGRAANPLPLLPPPPVGDDRSAPSLRAYERQVLAQFGPHYRDVPLDVKAEFFQWLSFHYNARPGFHVFDWSSLADEPGKPPGWMPGSDTSTWNGALLCGLSYKYAVTKDPRTLEQIAAVLQGLHLCLEVTGKSGFIARSVNLAADYCHDHMLPYTAPDGTAYRYWGSPAKGTYNQVVGGYARMMMYAYRDLPPEVQQMARQDMTALVMHVIDHDYHLTDRDGNRTPYGNITPLMGSVGVPFNAQVAYLIVAAGFWFPPEDSQQSQRVLDQFRKLRGKHHVYYEDPWRSVVRPQQIGGSPFLKGQNDRAHVTYAAFVGLELEMDGCRRTNQPLDGKFFQQLGQTLSFSMEYLQRYYDSLSHLMWAATLNDRFVFDAIIEHKPNTTRAGVERGLAIAVENLRRFKLDRFQHNGVELESHRPQWVDAFKPGYHWHCPQTKIWQVTGPPTNQLYTAADYLHAYWLMRYYRLDEHPALQRLNLSALAPTRRL